MSRVVATPGLRTDSGRGQRAAIGSSIALVAGDPVLWLLGLLGFAARGGLVLLAIPALTLPSPVLLSILLRGELTASGVSAHGVALALGIGVVFGLLLLVGLALSAVADVASFERVVDDPESEVLRLGRGARRLDRRERASLMLWVAAAQSVALVPILLAVLLAGASLGDALLHEIRVPGTTGVPLVFRAIARAWPALATVLVVAAVAEIASSLAARNLLATRYGLQPDGPPPATEVRALLGGAARSLTRPLRTFITAAVAWLVTIVALATTLGAVGLTWAGTRDVLIGGGGDDVSRLVALVVALGGFLVVWSGALVVMGAASALRGALWTTDSLR